MQTAIPCDFVLFGAAGDLALRKLFAAMYRSHRQKLLADSTRIFAVARGAVDRDAFLAKVKQHVQKNISANEWLEDDWPSFAARIIPQAIDIAQRDTWSPLQNELQKANHRRLFYLSIPPDIFEVTCRHLSELNLITDNSCVVVEKPIGYDVKTAKETNDKIARYFREDQIFRIDHYLGKETVQNLLALRFTNILFESLWNANYIDHIQISIAETVGLEGRTGFYDQAGAMRDMVQNHLLQLLCLIAMEPPHKLNADSIRTEKLKVLDALRPIKDRDVDGNVVRGQYVAGYMEGQSVPSYRDELGHDSRTETYVGMRVFVDNWRWARVPFYLRTGKRLRKRRAEIVIQFKDLGHRIYDESVGPLHANRLIIRLQPDEGMRLSLMAKKMDTFATRLHPVALNLNFNDSNAHFHSDAYQRLILDAIANEGSLFIDRMEVEKAWRFVDPIIAHWKKMDIAPEAYAAGSWGPDAADFMLARDGRRWANPPEGQN